MDKMVELVGGGSVINGAYPLRVWLYELFEFFDMQRYEENTY